MRTIIFVIDSADRENMDDARDALWEVLYEEQLEPRPILILANKQDNPVSESNVEISLKANSCKNRKP